MDFLKSQIYMKLLKCSSFKLLNNNKGLETKRADNEKNTD